MTALISAPQTRKEIILYFGLDEENAKQGIADLKLAGKIIESRIYSEPTVSNKKKSAYFIMAQNLTLNFEPQS